MIARSRALATMVAAALAGCASLPGGEPSEAASAPAAATTAPAPKAAAPAPAATAATPSASAAAPRPPEASEGRRRFERGVAHYEQGRFAEAIRTLKDAPELAGEPAETRVRALKVVAFSQCLLEQRAACRRSFDALLALDPVFRLSAAEAGHPSWGPVFAAARAAVPVPGTTPRRTAAAPLPTPTVR